MKPKVLKVIVRNLLTTPFENGFIIGILFSLALSSELCFHWLYHRNSVFIGFIIGILFLIGFIIGILFSNLKCGLQGSLHFLCLAFDQNHTFVSSRFENRILISFLFTTRAVLAGISTNIIKFEKIILSGFQHMKFIGKRLSKVTKIAHIHKDVTHLSPYVTMNVITETQHVLLFQSHFAKKKLP